VEADCTHPAYSLVEGVLVCVSCGEPSASSNWPENVYGAKAVEQQTTENKGRFWPSESKRSRPGGRK
jgi:hypothetical protein